MNQLRFQYWKIKPIIMSKKGVQNAFSYTRKVPLNRTSLDPIETNDNTIPETYFLSMSIQGIPNIVS